MSNQQLDKMPVWAEFIYRYFNQLIFDAPGKRVWKVAWWINFGKISPVFVFLGMMAYYDNFSTAAWVYTALHGVYGYCWLIKDFGFRDHQLNQKTSVLGALLFYITLGVGYIAIGWLFISRHVEPSNLDLFFAICLHHLGVVTMIAADGQRHFTLKYRKGLFTDGLYRYTRNPNYLGEIMLYGAYVYLADHWIAWLVLVAQSVLMFFPRMYAKDRAISRHPGWAEYKAQTGLVIPWGLINGQAFRDQFKKTATSESRQ